MNTLILVIISLIFPPVGIVLVAFSLWVLLRLEVDKYRARYAKEEELKDGDVYEDYSEPVTIQVGDREVRLPSEWLTAKTPWDDLPDTGPPESEPKSLKL